MSKELRQAGGNDGNGRRRVFTLNRRAFSSALVGICVTAAIGCAAQNEECPPYRYRLTLAVDTPEGVRTGSSVIEVRTFKIGPQSQFREFDEY